MRLLVIPPDYGEAARGRSESAAQDVVERIQVAVPMILASESNFAEARCKTSKVAELVRVDDDLWSHTLAELEAVCSRGEKHFKKINGLNLMKAG